MFWTVGASAQAVDQCALQPAPGPLAPLIHKLTCRLQIEDNARMAAEENLIVAQADQKIAEGKIDSLEAEANLKAKTAKDTAAYWKAELAGLMAKEANDQRAYAELSDRVNAACAWRGVQNEPTAKMCRWWHGH
jgi:hypothetical protein